jgi:outer membrane protein assembly factor BamA
LSASPTYLLTRLHAAYDWRDSPGYTRRGGYYRLDWSDYREQSDGSLSFRRVDADVRQMIPILRENWVIALRATVSTTSTAAGQEVPFFLMPQLGGGSDLRGFPSWRFRDRHRVLFSAEYRWTPSHFIDMAIFHDAGKVSASRSQLGLGGLRHTTGIGIRLHAPAATFIRLEVGRGAEGLGLIMAFGPSF